VTTEASKEIRELKRKVIELERAIQVLKEATSFFRAGARPAAALICEFIDRFRDRFGVVPICRALSAHGIKIAPRTY
jgi:hypothetical protein